MSYQLPHEHPDTLRNWTHKGKTYKVTHEQFARFTELRSSMPEASVLDHVIRTMELFAKNVLTRGPMVVLAKGLDGATMEEVSLFHLATRIAVEDEYPDLVMYELLKIVAARDTDYCNLIVTYRALIYSAGIEVFLRMITDTGVRTVDEARSYTEVLGALTAFHIRDPYTNTIRNRGHRIITLIPLINSHLERSADIASFVLKRRTTDPEVIGAYLETAASTALLEGAM